MKFTGHERDLNRPGQVDDLDYMHARYCSPLLGRFLSPDPLGAEPNRPQGWNRYAYALNNPLKWVDPTGETVSLADLEEAERTILLERLNEFTGNTYDVNESLELLLVEVGATSSAIATDYLNKLIAPEAGVFNILATEGKNTGDHDTQTAYINFGSFEGADYGRVDPRAFNLGSTLIHELYHASTGEQDLINGVFSTSHDWTGPGC
jgi:RHS repeat-associated protein